MAENENDNNETAASLIEQGEKLAKEGNLDEAEEVLKRAVEMEPDNALTHYNLSLVYMIKLKRDIEQEELWEDYADDEGYFEEAIAHCQTAVELNPKMVEAHNNLGTLYALRGWKEKAIEQWEESLAIHPDQPQVREDIITLRDEVE